jgi:hypothetical protein
VDAFVFLIVEMKQTVVSRSTEETTIAFVLSSEIGINA